MTAPTRLQDHFTFRDEVPVVYQRVTTRKGRPRDSQRSKVYEAEVLCGRRFDTVAEMQDYCDRLTRSAWWKRRWPSCQKVRIHSGAGNRRATCQNSLCPVIKMPRWARNEATLLHEMAHAACYAEHRLEVAAHGPEFCAILLDLIGRQMGPSVKAHQKLVFVKAGVKHKRPSKTKRTLTPAQREAAIERLALARAAKERS